MTTQDFEKRIDLTGLVDVTGSEMNQLLDTAKPASDKGLNIVTTDTALDTPEVPDPNTLLQGITPTYWVNYTWVRKPFDATGRVKAYFWNEFLASDAIYLKWEEHASDDASDTAEEALTKAEQALTENDAQDTALTALQALATDAASTAQTADENAALALANLDSIIADLNSAELAITALQTAVDGTKPITEGGTGATGVAQALANFGLTRIPLAVFIFRELQAANTNGGTFTSGIQTKRTLNDSASSGNLPAYAVLNVDSTFDLATGIWEIEFEAPACHVALHKATLYNVTGAVVSIIGTSEFTESGAATIQTKSRGKGIITVNASTKFQINHICSTTQATNGLGVACNLGGLSEIYTIVTLKYLGSV